MVPSPLGAVLGARASAGPEAQESKFVAATKRASLMGAPGTEMSLTSRRVTPLVSPSAAVDATTPS